MRELHVAYADQLAGPWHQHAANPVRQGLESSRPGGKPFVLDEALLLPMQDCVTGYGAGINVLRIENLTPARFSARIETHLSPDGLLPKYDQGLHTLAWDDDVSVIDVKGLMRLPSRLLMRLEYCLRRWLGRQ
jgi:hypothetical protein